MMDPHSGYNFRVEVSGIDNSQTYFNKCTAFSVESSDITYREGGNIQVTRHIPSKVQYDPVTLSYGVTDSSGLWDWLMQTASGKVERKNVTISLVDNDGATRESWLLINAWPQKWQGTELEATSNQLAIAQLTFVFDDLRREAS